MFYFSIRRGFAILTAIILTVSLAACTGQKAEPAATSQLPSNDGQSVDTTAPASANVAGNSVSSEVFSTTQDWKDSAGYSGTVTIKTWVGVQGNGATTPHPADNGVTIPAAKNTVCVIPFSIEVVNTTESADFASDIKFTVSGLKPTGDDLSAVMDSYNPKAPTEGAFVYTSNGWVYPDYWGYSNQISRSWTNTKKGFVGVVKGYLAVGSYYTPAHPDGNVDFILDKVGLTIYAGGVAVQLKMRANGNVIELYGDAPEAAKTVAINYSGDGGDLHIEGNYSHYGFVDDDYNVIIPFDYAEVGKFHDGLAWIYKGGFNKTFDGFIDTQNNKVFEANGYVDVGDYGDGLIPVTTDEYGRYWGFVNLDNESVIQMIYNDIETPVGGRKGFNDGLAVVGLNGAYGVIDVAGEYVIPMSKEYNVHSNAYYTAIITDTYIILGEYMFTRDGKQLRNDIKDVYCYNNNGLLVYFTDELYHCGILNQVGEITLDFGERIQSKLGHSLVKLSDVPTETVSDYWFLLVGNDSNLNLVNLDGEFMFDDWKPGTFIGEIGMPEFDWDYSGLYGYYDLISLYSARQNKTFVYDANGSEIWSGDGKWDYWSNGIIVRPAKDRSSQPQGNPIIANIYDGTSSEFGSVEVVNETTAIVSDTGGIFFGLFINGKLAYDLEYTKIDNGSSLDYGGGWQKNKVEYTLHKGNEETKILVSRNGTVKPIE
jgi:hypothetical protein